MIHPTILGGVTAQVGRLGYAALWWPVFAAACSCDRRWIRSQV